MNCLTCGDDVGGIGIGRPRRYCSTRCRGVYDYELKRARLDVARIESALATWRAQPESDARTKWIKHLEAKLILSRAWLGDLVESRDAA